MYPTLKDEIKKNQLEKKNSSQPIKAAVQVMNLR
jgi:hypothetical protein